MKKTTFGKLLSTLLSLVILATVFASLALSANAADAPFDAPVDLGYSFTAKIIVPALNKAFTNKGDDNVIAADIADSDAQIWKFEKIDSDNNGYQVSSLLDNKFLAVHGEFTSELANVGVLDGAQILRIYSIGDQYLIQPEGAEGKVIDVNGVDFNVQYWKFDVANLFQQYEINIIETFDEPSSEESEAVESTDESAAESEAVESADESAVESADESADESEVVESADESNNESKAEESKTESKAEESKTESKAEDNDNGPSAIIFVVIGVVAVVAIAAVVIIIKKKSN